MLHRCTLALLLAFAFALGGCDKSKINDDNFAKIKVGMSMGEVTNTLGSSYDDETPSAGYNANATGLSSSAAAENTYVFKSKDQKFIITVKSGKVVATSKAPL